jgi:hypothetical protein
MSPEQAKIIAAWEDLHPIFYVSPSKSHVPSPGDPWRFFIRQRDDDLVIGAVSRVKFMATRTFNEALVSQLRDSLMTGRMPKPLATLGIPTPLASPEGVLTAHPRDAKAPEPEPENKPTRQAPWNITPLQNRILDAWEGLHDEFRVVADAGHSPTRFAPWKWRIERKSDAAVVGSVTKFTQDVRDQSQARIVEQLKSALQNKHVPTQAKPRPVQRRDEITGQILPRLSKDRPASSTPSETGWPKDLPAGCTNPDCIYPPPVPNLGRTVLTGKALELWKYGPHKEWHSDFNKKGKLWI